MGGVYSQGVGAAAVASLTVTVLQGEAHVAAADGRAEHAPVALLGTGIMGSAMARNLVVGGLNTTVWASLQTLPSPPVQWRWPRRTLIWLAGACRIDLRKALMWLLAEGGHPPVRVPAQIVDRRAGRKGPRRLGG